LQLAVASPQPGNGFLVGTHNPSNTQPAIARVMFFNTRYQTGPGGRPPKKQDGKIAAKISRHK
jgi:hypothetical protein